MINFKLSKIACLTLILFVSSTTFAEEKETQNMIPGTTKVTAEDIFELVDEHDDLVIIDARKTEDREKGYIEGSIGLPDTVTTPSALAEYIPAKQTPVLFYCNGPKCGRSVKSSLMAIAEGYKNIYWFRGGWEEWSGKGLPVAKD